MKSLEKILEDSILKLFVKKGIEISEYKKLDYNNMNEEERDMYDLCFECMRQVSIEVINECANSTNNTINYNLVSNVIFKID